MTNNFITSIILVIDISSYLLTEIVNRLRAEGFDKPGLVCECVPSCIEPEYKVVSDRKG